MALQATPVADQMTDTSRQETGMSTHTPTAPTRRAHRTVLVAALATVIPLGALAPTTAAPQAPVDAALASVPQCADDALTPEAHDVIETITDGGEFEYPGKDGSTFGNREGLLPAESSGYYAEYTVPTPGEDDRGARRIVTGGDTTPTSPDTAPEHWYWTDDHYESFCEFSA
mgnify:CR=1 FL=1